MLDRPRSFLITPGKMRRQDRGMLKQIKWSNNSYSKSTELIFWNCRHFNVLQTYSGICFFRVDCMVCSMFQVFALSKVVLVCVSMDFSSMFLASADDGYNRILHKFVPYSSAERFDWNEASCARFLVWACKALISSASTSMTVHSPAAQVDVPCCARLLFVRTFVLVLDSKPLRADVPSSFAVLTDRWGLLWYFYRLFLHCCWGTIYPLNKASRAGIIISNTGVLWILMMSVLSLRTRQFSSRVLVVTSCDQHDFTRLTLDSYFSMIACYGGGTREGSGCEFASRCTNQSLFHIYETCIPKLLHTVFAT